MAFSTAEGIFHPYYISQLAPFTAALVGAGAGLLLRGGRRAAVWGAVGVAAAVATESWCCATTRATAAWWPQRARRRRRAGARGALVDGLRGPWRAGAVAGVAALFLLCSRVLGGADLDHATTGPFPAGGPAGQAFGGGPPGGGFARRPGSAGGFGRRRWRRPLRRRHARR